MERFNTILWARKGVPPGAGRWRMRGLGAAAAVAAGALAFCILLSPDAVFSADGPESHTATTPVTAADLGAVADVGTLASHGLLSGDRTLAGAATLAGDAALTGNGALTDPGGVAKPATPEGTASGTPDLQTAVSRSTIPETSRGALLVKLPWGGGNGQVGLVSPGEGLVRGPEALALDATGRIAVLDSVNRRLVLLDPDGTFHRNIGLDLAEPRFLAVDEQRLYVLDCDADRRLCSYDWEGGFFGAWSLPLFTDVVTGLFVTDDGPCVEIAHEQSVLIEADTVLGPAATGGASSSRIDPAAARPLIGRPLAGTLATTAKVAFRPGQGTRLELYKIDKDRLGSTQTVVSPLDLAQGQTLEHLISVDGDGDGGLIIGARLLDAGSRDTGGGRAMRGPSLVLSRVGLNRFVSDAAGGLDAAAEGDTSLANLEAAASPSDDVPAVIGTIFLDEYPFAYLGQPYVVAPDGRIVQPMADQTGYSILLHSFGQATAVMP